MGVKGGRGLAMGGWAGPATWRAGPGSTLRPGRGRSSAPNQNGGTRAGQPASQDGGPGPPAAAWRRGRPEGASGGRHGLMPGGAPSCLRAG
jgi:hypothetical protein